MVAARVAKAKFVWHQRTILSNSPLWKFIPFLCSHFIAISQSVLKSAPKNLSNYSIIRLGKPTIDRVV